MLVTIFEKDKLAISRIRISIKDALKVSPPILNRASYGKARIVI